MSGPRVHSTKTEDNCWNFACYIRILRRGSVTKYENKPGNPFLWESPSQTPDVSHLLTSAHIRLRLKARLLALFQFWRLIVFMLIFLCISVEYNLQRKSEDESIRAVDSHIVSTNDLTMGSSGYLAFVFNFDIICQLLLRWSENWPYITNIWNNVTWA